MITHESVLERLSKVRGPDRNMNIVALKLVDDIVIQGNDVTVLIKVPSSRAAELEPLRLAAEKTIENIDGIGKVRAILTSQSVEPPTVSSDNEDIVPDLSPNIQTEAAPAQAPSGVPGISSIIAVASGKGGVGKSTTSVNLALALLGQGKKVGLLDADIYGPSIPRMLAITGKPKAKGRILSPLTGYGLKVMSMGFLVEEDTPMIWRGPMVMSAVTQMLHDVDWGELDYLVIDMPPGTGDVQLTLAQQVPLSGAVIVSTPQDIALLDARKGLNMFRKVNVPILGIIENMSLFICPKCGKQSDIFGCDGARDEAEKLGVPFLGSIPLHMDIRINSDAGTPEVLVSPDGPHSKIYVDICTQIDSRINVEAKMGAAKGPRIIVQ